MKQNVILVLLGVLIGAMLMTALPSMAHHGASTRKLQDRVYYLEQIFEKGCGFGDPVTWGSSFRNMWGDPTLTSDGLYGTQINVPSGCTGDAAVWNSNGLGC